MDLKHLKVTNYIREDFNKFSQTGALVYGFNALSVFRAVRMRIEVQEPSFLAVDGVYDSIEGCEDGDVGCYDMYQTEGEMGWGYWSICTNDMTVSGYEGLVASTWWNATESTINGSAALTCHPNNPLYKTEFHPHDTGAGNYISSTNVDFDYGHATANLRTLLYDVPGGTAFGTVLWEDFMETWPGQGPGEVNRKYKRFDENNTITYGHQDVQAFINDGGNTSELVPLNADSVDQLFLADYTASDGSIQGIWQHQPPTMDPWLKYVDPALTARNMWDPHVHEIVMFDTVGIDAEGRGLPGNAIDVFVIFKNEINTTDWSFNTSLSDGLLDPTMQGIVFEKMPQYIESADVNNLVNVDFDGQPVWTYKVTHTPTWDPQSMPAQINDLGGVQINWSEDDNASNNVTVGLVPRPGFIKMESQPTLKQVSDGRYESDYVINTITGKYRSRDWNKIGILKVSTEVTEDSNGNKSALKYISKIPTLKTDKKENIRLEVAKKEKVNGKIWCYYLDVLYKDTGGEGYCNSDLIVETSSYPVARTRDLGIFGISTGSNKNISHAGGYVDIIVKGVPGSKFGFVFNESFYDSDTWRRALVSEQLSSKTKHYPQRLYHTDDISLLSNRGNTTYFYGQEMPVITGVIGKSGVYSHRQKIPQITTFKTKVNQNSGVIRKTVIVDKLTTDVKIRDDIFNDTKTQAIGKVSGIDTGTKEITVYENFDVADITDNTSLRFDRARVYTAHLIEDLCDTFNSQYQEGVNEGQVIVNIPKTMLTFYQGQDPVMHIQHSISASNYKVSKYNTVDTSLNNGDEHDIYLGGILNKNFHVDLELTLANGAHRWATFLPAAHVSYEDFFTDMDHKNNGGYKVEVKNLRSSALNQSNAKVNFSYDVIVSSIPSGRNVLSPYMRDFSLACNLDNIYTITT